MRLSLLLITLHLLHRRAVSLRLLGLLALLASGPLRAQETAPSFRIGDIVWTSTSLLSFQTTTHAIFDTRHSTTIYTHGVGATNEVTTLNSSTLLDLSTLYLYGNRYQLVQGYAATNEWIWQDGALTEVWYCDTNFVRDTYIYNLAPLDMQSGTWARATPRTPMPAYLPSDLSNGFKGPVGTVVTTDEHGRTTTDTYTTTAGLYVPGDPASTNEHFYRVQLSLEYDNRTPIPITFVTNYLGFAPDVNSNVYVWLREGQEYTAKPMFNGAAPSFYSYGAEAFKADQLWGLTVATIRMGSSTTWPGERPANMASHMGYPTDEGYFSDDQLAIDYILNSPLSSIFETLINAALAARGYPVWYEKDSSRGQVTTLTEDERKYMVMALLARSTNPDPPVELDHPNLELFIGTNFVYRLVNEFGIEAAGFNSKFGHDVAGRNIQRKRAEIGKTKIEFKEDVIVRLKIWPGTPIEYLLELGFDKADVNAAIHSASGLWFMTNSPGAGHNTIQGGTKGSPSVSYICSGRAGPVLVTLEQPLLRKMPPDFFCWTRYRVTDTSVGKEHELSLNSNTTWPTFFEYRYDFDERKYKDPITHGQVDTPFDGFLSLGP